jgi:hypothetical protein
MYVCMYVCMYSTIGLCRSSPWMHPYLSAGEHVQTKHFHNRELWRCKTLISVLGLVNFLKYQLSHFRILYIVNVSRYNALISLLGLVKITLYEPTAHFSYYIIQLAQFTQIYQITQISAICGATHKLSSDPVSNLCAIESWCQQPQAHPQQTQAHL